MNGDIRLLRSRCGTFHPYVREIALDKSGCLIVEKLWICNLIISPKNDRHS